MGAAHRGRGRYFGFYNEERPHQALGYRTPLAVYAAGGGGARAAGSAISRRARGWVPAPRQESARLPVGRNSEGKFAWKTREGSVAVPADGLKGKGWVG